MEQALKQRILLAVEGNDDRQFLRAIERHLRKENSLAETEWLIWSLNGKDNFEASTQPKPNTLVYKLSALINKPTIFIDQLDENLNPSTMFKDLTHLLLVLDADEKPPNTQARLEANFKQLAELGAKLDPPNSPGQWHPFTGDPAGKPGPNLTCGYYLLPGPDTQGIWRTGSLETLLLASLTPDKTVGDDGRAVEAKPLLPCVDKFIECMENSSKEVGIKPHVQAYLASQSVAKEANKYCSLPVSFEQGHWSLDHPCFGQLVDFLRQADLA